MKKTVNYITMLLAGTFLLLANVSNAQSVINPAATDNDVEIGVVEHLDDYLPDSISLINEAGEQVWLSDLIDKPTVLNFVYYRCPGICSPLMEAVADVMDKSDLVPGEDYQVFTISFDPSETIDLGIRKKNNYLNLMNNPAKVEEAKTGWQFFVSDSASIVNVTRATGFKYKKAGNDFTHAASLIVVSPNEKITRYLNGLFFLPFEWKMAIVEASKGQSGATMNKVLRFCFSYDPQGQTYVLNVTKISGIIIIFFGLVLLLFLVLKPKKKVN
ncbi:SCO family protein [uncultured Draconibacterium sp.]|uniref:SCO family protein n=1 Tax=uncultured Draconibacterium sp. TaxID=1573823 RepID=UPI0025DC061F|nr:SCO family protein [uncultured Draconibacterium sp.]